MDPRVHGANQVSVHEQERNRYRARMADKIGCRCAVLNPSGCGVPALAVEAKLFALDLSARRTVLLLRVHAFRTTGADAGASTGSVATERSEFTVDVPASVVVVPSVVVVTLRAGVDCYRAIRSNTQKRRRRRGRVMRRELDCRVRRRVRVAPGRGHR